MDNDNKLSLVIKKEKQSYKIENNNKNNNNDENNNNENNNNENKKNNIKMYTKHSYLNLTIYKVSLKDLKYLSQGIFKSLLHLEDSFTIKKDNINNEYSFSNDPKYAINKKLLEFIFKYKINNLYFYGNNYINFFKSITNSEINIERTFLPININQQIKFKIPEQIEMNKKEVDFNIQIKVVKIMKINIKTNNLDVSKNKKNKQLIYSDILLCDCFNEKEISLNKIQITNNKYISFKVFIYIQSFNIENNKTDLTIQLFNYEYFTKFNYIFKDDNQVLVLDVLEINNEYYSKSNKQQKTIPLIVTINNLIFSHFVILEMK